MSREIVLDGNVAVITTKLQWFHFSQNNSGGYFKEDEDQAEDVFVQAATAQEAIDYIWPKLYHGYCECCGERWSNYMEDSDGTDRPEVYGVDIYHTEKGSYRNECRLHFYDGHVEAYKYGSKPIDRLPPVGA